VKDAIAVGYRNFDCSNLESEFGHALSEKLASGDVNREDLFITCKVFC
jgi:diketogulonate reductase-like aldo/keto reductase